MTEFIRFGLLGLGTGGMYALAALGVVLIYRGSGVVNFAHGAIGVAGAYLFYELHVRHGAPFAIAFPLGIAFSMLIGAITHLAVMRPLRRASPLVRLVATLGILLTIQAIAILRYGTNGTFVPSSLPDHVLHLTASLTISQDRVSLLAIAAALTTVLALFYRRTSFGLATAAVAENQRAAASVGWSPDLIATINWALGSGLAGAAAIFIVPITSLQVGVMTTVTTYTLAIALVAGFSSFPLTLAAGLAVGMLQSWVLRYQSGTIGLTEALPFIIVLIILVLRGKALPIRGTVLDRLPAVGTGRVRVRQLIGPLILTVALVLVLKPAWVNALTASIVMAIILLSLVVVTGYAGQLSLGQYALAGAGAYICGRLNAAVGLPLPLAFVLAILCAVPVGIVFGLPALRTRGVNLAILTLGLGVAVGAMIFNNLKLTGPSGFDTVSTVRFFGVDFSATAHPDRYAMLVLGWFVVSALAVANMRRSRVGRRLLTVRNNERAAAAMGISVVEGKLYAFVLSAVIASIGGILFAYQTTSVQYGAFSQSFESINAIALAVIGGIGSLVGPLFGSMLLAGGIGGKVSELIFSNGFTKYLPLIAGIVFLVVVIQDPDGLASAHAKALHNASRIFRRRPQGARPQLVAVPPVRGPAVTAPTAARVPDARLTIERMSVRYGGVCAVDDVSFEIRTGRVTGVIGPNGAGKTTLIDAITGFVKPSGGRLFLNGEILHSRSATARARLGVSRSFQSLELFDDMTVGENLLAASDTRDRVGYLTSLAHAGRQTLPSDVLDTVAEFDLLADLDRPVTDLSYARRRLLAIARAVATRPSILLLDEPAAGLSDHESAELARAVRRLVDEHGVGILLVEHDMQFVMSLCDTIVVLDFGRMIALGEPDDIKRDPRVRSAYLGTEPLDGLQENGEAAAIGRAEP